MNGEPANNPRVPVTTLAGTVSLTELLPELPLPSVVGEKNRSLLFHPRVAEEAERHLNCQDRLLVQQLAHALASTSAEHIQLKDPYNKTAPTLDANITPPLLKSILSCNPTVFSGANKEGSDEFGGGNLVNHVNNFSGFQDAHSGPSDYHMQAIKHPMQHSNHVAPNEFENQPIVKLMKLSSKDVTSIVNANRHETPNHKEKGSYKSKNSRNSRGEVKSKFRDLDDSEDNEKKPVKYFKSREKERDEKKRKDKADRKRSRIVSDDEYDPDHEKKKIKMEDDLDDDHIRSPNSTKKLLKKPQYNRKKIEKKLVGGKEKVNQEELMETGVYQRFTRTVEKIFDNVEDLDLNAEMDEDGDVPQEYLIAKYDLSDLCSETAKLKSLGAMALVPPERVVRLLNILEKNVRDGARITPITDEDNADDEKLYVELVMERILRSIDASLTTLYILTSENMSKRVYLEDVIEKCIQFAKFQLINTIYPSFDPVYRLDSRKDSFIGNMKKKRAHVKDVRNRAILSLYNKLHELVSLLADLLLLQTLTDTSVLLLSSLGVAPFFVENVPELQLTSLKLVTTIFSKYDKHRRLLLDDILASIARLPSSKRSLRSYRLNTEEHIQMLTALVLQLIQCVVELPDELSIRKEQTVDRDVLVSHKYEMAMTTAYSFLSVFLQKTGSKSEEIDYRPLFENFVQDLLLTVNKPEWPAAELLLNFLGNLLVQKFSNKGTDVSLRISSLDCLGTVAARLRRDAVSSRLKVAKIDAIINEIKEEENKDSPYVTEVPEQNNKKNKKKKGPKVEESQNCDQLPYDEEEERTLFLQRVLLDWLAVNSQSEVALLHSRHFYIGQWYRDAYSEILRQRVGPVSPKSKKPHVKKKKKRSKDESSEEEMSSANEENEEKSFIDDATKAEVTQLAERRKQFLLTKISAFPTPSPGTKLQTLQTHIDYENAELITRYLASKRSFSQSFDNYLKQILRVLPESAIAVRTKAMKCLTMVVEADPAVLARSDMQMGVQHSFLDHSTSVREAAVDLVGKFVLSRPELIDKYYDVISARILDTGVSVRKRVIKILKDVCLEYPDFPKIPEICVKMIRRINDEEGIKKLVQEVFQNMWFTPVSERPNLDKDTLLIKVNNITEVVIACKETGLDWFEQLLHTMFKPKEDKDDVTKVNTEPPKVLLTACRQIVDCLVNHVLLLEGKGASPDEPREESVPEIIGSSSVDDSTPRSASQRLVACLNTLYLFSKIRPQLLVNHAITLQPYLSLKCQTQGDYTVIGVVARTLELVVPLMEHPSETFLAQLEEDAVKLIILHDRTVITSCLALLGSIVNTVTRNYNLIKDCFNNYYSFIVNYRKRHQENNATATNQRLEQYKPLFRRSLYTVGLLLKHFDFSDPGVLCGLPEDITDQVIDTLLYFMQATDTNIRFFTLQSLGSVCIRHYNLMMGDELKNLYNNLLTNVEVNVRLRTQTLLNIETYLQEEEIRMIKQDKEWAKTKTKENLKEMCDIQSGMASTIIQLYLKQILECVVAANVTVRQSALRVIQLVLAQGLVHPVQIVPYLICMSTDCEEVISHSADRQLQDIEKKYPGFINMKAMHGFRLSYRLQTLIQQDLPTRGYKEKQGEVPGALNGFLYSTMRNTKHQRRAVAMSLLKQFDEMSRASFGEVLFIADNLAYFSYQVIDEPLFIIHHIDVMISVTGSNLLQSFKESLLPSPNAEMRTNPETGQVSYVDADEDDDDDVTVESIISRLPADLTPLVDCMAASQNCLLLLVLKEQLKEVYAITDNKTWNYSPSDTSKQYEKSMNRKSNVKFNPKNTLHRLRETKLDPPNIGDEQKRRLIEEYFAFKNLMNKIDREDDSDFEGKAAVNHVTSRTQRLQEQAKQSDALLLPGTHDGWQGNNDIDAINAAVPNVVTEDNRSSVKPITIRSAQLTPVSKDRHHKRSSSHKKHKKKKRRKKHSDDEDDTNEFSDPDFLV